MKWMYQEVMEGIGALFALRLANHPAADQIQKTTEVWCKAVARHIGPQANERVDTIRLREGFERLIDTCERWPSPAQLFTAMPDRALNRFHQLPEPDQIERISVQEQRENARKAMGMIHELLRGKTVNQGVVINEKQRDTSKAGMD